jgi:hypothetical protein
MDRKSCLLKYVTKEQSGIEIAPWIDPVAPKREGYNCLIVDVFDTETLRARAAADPSIASYAAAIEEVDLVGSATELDV